MFVTVFVFVLLAISVNSYFVRNSRHYQSYSVTKKLVTVSRRIENSHNHSFLLKKLCMSLEDNSGTDSKDSAVINEDKPEGYLNSDFSAIGDGKQFRVLLYIGLALIPCLLLVPFFLSRDFVPPVDPSAQLP